jgi:hypothetical protein
MISSQEGTEDRRPLALFLLPGRWRADCSSADSAWAGGVSAGSGSGCAGVVVAEAAGESAVAGVAADVPTDPAGVTVVGSAAVAGSDCAGA